MERRSQVSPLFNKVIQLIGLSLLVKILGFMREIFMAYYYGTSITADVFVASLNIPSVIFALFGTAITTSFIPLYSEIKEKEGESAALKYTNNILNFLLLISGGITILGILFSDILVKVFVGGFTGEAYEMCNIFVKIIMITVMMTVVQYIYNGYLQTQGKFNQQSIMNIPYSVILIGAIILSHYQQNFYLLAIGATFASFSQLVYLRILIARTPYRYHMTLKVKDDHLKKTIFLIAPVFLSTAVNQLNNIVDRSLASRLMEGSISALNYSNKVNSIVLEVIIMSITTIFYPTLSALFAKNDDCATGRFIISYLNSVAMIVIPIAFFINFFAEEMIHILFGRGAFGENEILFTARALKIIAFGLIGSAFRDVLNKIFYSMQDTVTPVKNGIVSILVNIILNFILVVKYEYLGIAFATVFSANLCTLLLMIQLFRKKKNIRLNEMVIDVLKILFSAFVVYFGAKLLTEWLYISNVYAYCFLYGIAMVGGYLGCLIILKERACIELVHRIGAVIKHN